MIYILSGAYLTHLFSGDPYHIRLRPVVPLIFGSCCLLLSVCSSLIGPPLSGAACLFFLTRLVYLDYPAQADVYTSETLLELATGLLLLAMWLVYRWDLVGRGDVAALKKARRDMMKDRRAMTPGTETLTSL